MSEFERSPVPQTETHESQSTQHTPQEVMAATTIAVIGEIQKTQIQIAAQFEELKKNKPLFQQKMRELRGFARALLVTTALAVHIGNPQAYEQSKSQPYSVREEQKSQEVTEQLPLARQDFQFNQVLERREKELGKFDELYSPEQTTQNVTEVYKTPSDSEVDRYGEFALGRTDAIDEQAIVEQLDHFNAPYPDHKKLAKIIKKLEKKYQIGAEYVLIIIAQETACGSDIQDGSAPLAGENNWGNLGSRDKAGKFPVFKTPEAGIEAIFNQLHRYHRVWQNLGDSHKKPAHTYPDALRLNYAPTRLAENRTASSNTEQRVKESEIAIQRWRDETALRKHPNFN